MSSAVALRQSGGLLLEGLRAACREGGRGGRGGGGRGGGGNVNNKQQRMKGKDHSIEYGQKTMLQHKLNKRIKKKMEVKKNKNKNERKRSQNEINEKCVPPYEPEVVEGSSSPAWLLESDSAWRVACCSNTLLSSSSSELLLCCLRWMEPLTPLSSRKATGGGGEGKCLLYPYFAVALAYVSDML